MAAVATTNEFGEAVERTYDAEGRVLSESGDTYPLLFGYDSDGHRTSLSTTRDGVNWDMTHWHYDAATGSCTNKVYADGSAEAYSYTSDALPLRRTSPDGDWTENVYDENRRRVGRLFRIVQGLRMRRKNHGMPTMVLPLVTRMGYMYTRKTSKLNHVLVPLCAIMIGAFIFGCANAPSDAESVILPETLSDINFNNRCLTEEEFDGVVSNIEMLVSSLDSFCSTNIINRSTLLKSIKRRPIVSQKHRNVAYLISRYAGEHVGVMFVVDSRDIVRRVVTFHGIE